MATYSKLIELLERGEVKRCYGVVSPDPGVRERSIDRIRSVVMAGVRSELREWNYDSRDLKQDGVAEVRASANTYPTEEGSKRCVVVRRCERNLKSESWEWLEEWFDARQIPDVHLVLSFDLESADTESAPFARVAKTGRLVTCPADPTDLEWEKIVAAEVGAGRVSVEGLGALRARTSGIGEALAVLEKARWLRGTIDARAIDLLAGERSTEEDCAEALLGEDRARAARAGRHAVLEEVSRSIGMIERRLRDAEAVREAARTSKNFTEAARRAGIPLFRAREAAIESKRATPETISRRRVALARADAHLRDDHTVAWLALCAEW